MKNNKNIINNIDADNAKKDQKNSQKDNDPKESPETQSSNGTMGDTVAISQRKRFKKSRLILILAIILIVIGGLLAIVAAYNGGLGSIGFARGRILVRAYDNTDRGTEIYDAYDYFDSININAPDAEIEIVQGEEFSVSGNIYGVEAEDAVAIRNGELIISTNEKVFAFLQLSPYGFEGNGHIKITYNPKELNDNALENIKIGDIYKLSLEDVRVSETIIAKNVLGSFNADGVSTGKLDLKNSIGTVKIQNSIIASKSEITNELGDTMLNNVTYSSLELKSNFGQVRMENLYGSNLELSSDFGDISAIGTLFGDIEININEGNVELDLDMKEEDISYEIENKLGDIKVNFDGMGKDVEMINEKARLRLDISSKLGDVDLDYRL